MGEEEREELVTLYVVDRGQNSLSSLKEATETAIKTEFKLELSTRIFQHWDET